MFAVLSLSPHLSFLNSVAAPTTPSLASETRALKTGEIPVEIMDVAQVSIIASMKAEGDDGNLCDSGGI